MFWWPDSTEISLPHLCTRVISGNFCYAAMTLFCAGKSLKSMQEWRCILHQLCPQVWLHLRDGGRMVISVFGMRWCWLLQSIALPNEICNGEGREGSAMDSLVDFCVNPRCGMNSFFESEGLSRRKVNRWFLCDNGFVLFISIAFCFICSAFIQLVSGKSRLLSRLCLRVA